MARLLTSKEMKRRAAGLEPFDEEELTRVCGGLEALAGDINAEVNWEQLRSFVKAHAHDPYKDWSVTERNSDELFEIINGPDSPAFCRMMERILCDGNWAGAEASTKETGVSAEESEPWIVLVTGLNGIRKSTSVYQDWWTEALSCALGNTYTGPLNGLPSGQNSFFRQLDYMIAVLAHEDLRLLYQANKNVEDYSSHKDAIFARYRSLAEMVGIGLVKQAKKRRMNVMVETSGNFRIFYFFSILFSKRNLTNRERH
jgi:hypothetical protein